MGAAASSPSGNGPPPTRTPEPTPVQWGDFTNFEYHERLSREHFSAMFPLYLYPGADGDPGGNVARSDGDSGRRRLGRTQSPAESSLVLENPPEDQRSCAICLQPFLPGEQVRLLHHCHHLFHDDCCSKWMTERKSQCPVCRFEYGLFRVEAGTFVHRKQRTTRATRAHDPPLDPITPVPDALAVEGKTGSDPETRTSSNCFGTILRGRRGSTRYPR
ncbi:hypothetical protein DFJ74DRAFT_119570 [Hyaloraphidium curvatum]|nr:hypothetical protein DFJ74DRAFT_119570 [Hyaloraphidium curvatum]